MVKTSIEQGIYRNICTITMFNIQKKVKFVHFNFQE